jgi:hypothetical protein
MDLHALVNNTLVINDNNETSQLGSFTEFLINLKNSDNTLLSDTLYKIFTENLYMVGGAARDLILYKIGRLEKYEIKDIDLTGPIIVINNLVDILNEESTHILLQSIGWTYRNNINHVNREKQTIQALKFIKDSYKFDLDITFLRNISNIPINGNSFNNIVSRGKIFKNISRRELIISTGFISYEITRDNKFKVILHDYSGVKNAVTNKLLKFPKNNELDESNENAGKRIIMNDPNRILRIILIICRGYININHDKLEMLKNICSYCIQENNKPPIDASIKKINEKVKSIHYFKSIIELLGNIPDASILITRNILLPVLHENLELYINTTDDINKFSFSLFANCIDEGYYIKDYLILLVVVVQARVLELL